LSETLLNMSYNGSCEEDFTILGVKLWLLSSLSHAVFTLSRVV
jgi:hypothetical protein